MLGLASAWFGLVVAISQNTSVFRRQTHRISFYLQRDDKGMFIDISSPLFFFRYATWVRRFEALIMTGHTMANTNTVDTDLAVA